jgi:RodZ C-terminal domain
MPETRGEWLVFLLGVLAIGALAGFIVIRHQQDTQGAATTGVGRVVKTPSAEAIPGSGSSTSPNTTPATTPAVAAAVRLRLQATNDTWLSVRAGSAAGKTLYEGTLATGESKTFTGGRIWVRFGAAADVTATLNGRALALPGGTYSASITSSGLGARSA